VPGEAKKADPLEGVMVDVRSPALVRIAVSDGVKAVLGSVVDVGLVSISEMYFSTDTVSLSFNSFD
jgi:hypothetical protein